MGADSFPQRDANDVHEPPTSCASRLLPMLADEFADIKPAEEIRACADAVLATFDGARVRTHVMTLAHRQTRECLRRDTCDLIATPEGS